MKNKVKRSITIDPDLLKLIQDIARAERRSVSQMINVLLAEYPLPLPPGEVFQPAKVYPDFVRDPVFPRTVTVSFVS